MPLGGIGRGKRKEALHQQANAVPGSQAQAPQRRPQQPPPSMARVGVPPGMAPPPATAAAPAQNGFNERGSGFNDPPAATGFALGSAFYTHNADAHGSVVQDRYVPKNRGVHENSSLDHVGEFGPRVSNYQGQNAFEDGADRRQPPSNVTVSKGFEDNAGAAEFSRPKASTYIPEEINSEQLFSEPRNQIGSEFERVCGLDPEQQDARLRPKVTFTGEKQPAARTFTAMNLHESLQRNIELMKFSHPTPIQAHSIPYLLTEHDMMACAQTGSGKTGAFLVPVINWLLNTADLREQTNIPAPFAIIIGPTRELVTQTMREAMLFSHETDIKVGQLYGKTSVQEQRQRLQRGCHILTATMGRLWQFIETQYIVLDRLKFVILDEADRMLDQGFGDDIDRMMSVEEMPGKGARQTMMFSATFPPSIQELAARYLVTDHVFISIGEVGSVGGNILQTVIQVGWRDKRDSLVDLLQKELEDWAKKPDGESYKCVVFTAKKRMSDYLGILLSEAGITTTTIHGDREQSERETALRQFKVGDCPVIIATDVLARGIDIENIHHVVNYDLPVDIETYVHRIGRTGRVGHHGRATSFYDPDTDAPLREALVQKLSESQQVVPEFLQGGGFGGGGEGWN